MSKIVVLDYGSSNLRSVAKALETVAEGNHKITVTDKPKIIYLSIRLFYLICLTSKMSYYITNDN